MGPIKFGIRYLVIMSILTGILYPLFITFGAKFTMADKANGSLIVKDNKVIGSTLIAQNFSSNSYFWPRPSANDYNGLKSGGSNLGPTSKRLQNQIKEREQKIGPKAPAELLYASGSGLDPHISRKAAYFQIERIAKERGISSEKLKEIIDAHVFEDRISRLGLHYVNVLILNLVLDNQQP